MNPDITIAICTRNHPDELVRCLRSLIPLQDKAFEVIVVDNASDGEATRDAALASGAKYVREPVVGLEPARNRAITEAGGEIIAFTDDDCEVDPGWLDAIAQAFSDPVVGAVTGQAISGPGANWVQRQFNSFARGFCSQGPVEVTPEAAGGVYYQAVLGVGANMAYRRDLLVALDGFPLATRGVGDDDYMQAAVARAGYKVRYAPDSIVYQKHRTGLGSTLARMFEYGMGAMRVLWLLSAEDRSFPSFVKNAAWVLARSELRALFRSLARLRPWHVLFSLASVSGCLAGLFLPWGWRAHITGRLPARGGLKGGGGGCSRGLPVLMYHRVGPPLPGSYPALTVSPERFRMQMDWLKRNGYTTIGAADWLGYCLEGKPLPDKPVMLTFDDAYQDLVEYAFPVLGEKAFTGTAFVVTNEVGGCNSWDEKETGAKLRCMDAEQIRHWSEQGMEFGAHSRTHADLTALSGPGLEDEIAGSGRDLAEITGGYPLSFAYPFGYYNEAVARETGKAFKLAFTCDQGLNTLGTNRVSLRRTMVQPRDTLLEFSLRVRFGFSQIERFRESVRPGRRLKGVLGMLRGS